MLTLFISHLFFQVSAIVSLDTKEEVKEAEEGANVAVIFSRTPFYAEGGGQVWFNPMDYYLLKMLYRLVTKADYNCLRCGLFWTHRLATWAR